MDDLVETLAIGLTVSLILIVVSWWFWKRYDRPSDAQLEREESIAKKKEETRMWRAVEAQMSQEKAALEEKALYERRKAEERARAMPPPSSEVSDAFAVFSIEQQAKPSFDQSEPAPSAEAALAEPMFEISDDDVLDIEEQVEVRQDQGVILDEGQQIPDMPDDVESEEKPLAIEHAVPSAPDLDALTGSNPPEEQEAWATTDEPPADDLDWSDNWFKNLEEE